METRVTALATCVIGMTKVVERQPVRDFTYEQFVKYAMHQRTSAYASDFSVTLSSNVTLP